MSNMNGLQAPANVPAQQSGYFTLYKDNNWQSSPLSFAITDYTAQARQSISGGPMQDAATWVAYNLPVGTVVTLMENVTSFPSSGLVGDLSGAGRCVDLVGTGQTEGLSLVDCNMNDCVSCFFWRTVDLDLGAVVLFENSDYGLNRSILFLSEWPSNALHSIQGWYLDDKLSSIDWTNLNDRQQVTFYNNVDGSGAYYDNVKGWGTSKQISDLKTVGFNDLMSSFEWVGLAPLKEEIDPITLDLTFAAGQTQSFSQTTNYENDTTDSQYFNANFDSSMSQTLTVTNSETAVVAYEFSCTESWEASEEVDDTGAKEGGSLTLKFSQSYTNVQTTTKSSTTTVQLDFSTQVQAAPTCITHATVVVSIATVPESSSYTTTAHRWYGQPVSGSVQDPANNNWWKRDETITIQVTGGLAGETGVQVSTTPLTASAAQSSTGQSSTGQSSTGQSSAGQSSAGQSSGRRSRAGR